MWDTTLQVVDQKCLRDPKIMQAIAVTPGDPPELDRKIPLLKTPQTSVKEHRENKPVLIGQLPPCWPYLMAPEGAV